MQGLATKRRDPGVLLAYAIARLRGLDGRAYVRTVNNHLSALFGRPSYLYAVHLDHGAYAHRPELQARVDVSYCEPVSEDSISFSDPWDPGFTWVVGTPTRRTTSVRDAVVHAPSGAVFLTNVDGPHSRVLGLVAGSASQQVAIERAVDLFSRRVPAVDESLTALPIPYTSNYYHWVIEVVPAIERAVRMAESEGLTLIAVPGFALKPWQEESLRAFGLPVERISTGFVRATRAVVSSPPGLLQIGRGDVSAIRAFSSRLAADRPNLDWQSPLGRPVFISRSLASRYEPYEAELEDALAASGWLVVRCEEHSMAEQVRLFSSARVCAAVHGAGLANMAWMPMGSTVVEIASNSYWHPSVPLLAHACDHRYQLLKSNVLSVDGLASALNKILGPEHPSGDA